MRQHDVIIVGSGLGGLLCGVILAKEGYNVGIIEQNKQIGGCLQTFSLQKKVFDSCVHYIGALDAGQVQNKIFSYAGILDELNFQQLDNDGFDRILFGDDEVSFPHAQGMDNFREQLLHYFPEERESLDLYLQALQTVGDSFPLYNLRLGDAEEKREVSALSIDEGLSMISNPKLKEVLLGNSLLYAGDRKGTPFYIHALVQKSYIESAYRCEGASSQISKLLLRRIRAYGGTIYRQQQVNELVEEDGQIVSAHTKEGEVFCAKHFIANIHPANLVAMLDSKLIKPVYRKRISTAANSISAFMVNIVLEPGRVKYRNHNVYWNRSTDALEAVEYKNEQWPANYALYFSRDGSSEFADTVAILCYMHASETSEWQESHNRTAAPGSRPAEYESFKKEKAALLLDKVAQRFPELKTYCTTMSVATPLTFRDYMGTYDGSMYGIVKDLRHPEATSVPVRTKIPNLLLTGQNVSLHGVLGVSITAVATCAELLGMEYLLNKLNQV